MNTKFVKANSFFNSLTKPVSLFKNLWYETTTALLHAPHEIDKTEEALAIANEVAASGREVIFLTTKQFTPHIENLSERLYICRPEYESIDDTRDYAQLVFDAIEEAVRSTDIRTFVIDSVTRIAALSFGRNASVAYVMKRLLALQVRCRLSLLVVADDTTKSVNKSLIALADSEIKLDLPEQTPASAESAPLVMSAKDAAVYFSSNTDPQPETRPMTRQQRRALQRSLSGKSCR